jgi:hypothetical protein
VAQQALEIAPQAAPLRAVTEGRLERRDSFQNQAFDLTESY